MNRRAVAAMLSGLMLIGCAHGRSTMPGLGQVDPNSALAPLPNLKDSINTGMTPVDPATRQVSLEVTPNGAGRPRATRPPKVGGAAPPPSSPASQFAVPAAGAVAPKAIPDEPAPLDAPPPDPGPAPAAMPPAPGPAAEPPAGPDPSPAPPPPAVADPLAAAPEPPPAAGSNPAPAAADAPAPDPPPEPKAAEPAPAPAPEAGSGPAAKGIDPASLPDLPIPDAPPRSVLKPPPPAEEPLPPLGAAPPAPKLQPTAQIVPTTAPRDPEVKPATRTTDPTTLRTGPRREIPVTQIAAVVGKEEITLTQLQAAVKERIPEGVRASDIPRSQMNMIARTTLDQLIERAMLIQAAKRKLKTDKNWDQMMRAFDRMWQEHELPEVLTKYHAADLHELKLVLKQRGRSYETLREEFKLKNAAMEFLRAEVMPKSNIDLPDMLAYYDEHKADYDRPARITWNEIEVKVANHKDRAEARAKAEAALGRIRRGEDFAEVAKALDEGANAKKGGRWEAAPDNGVIPAVNEALNTIPPGHASPIIEGPASYHIVKVETLRRAGPATFAEVQGEVRNKMREKKYNAMADAYLEKLRANTLITSMFDGTASAPSLSNGGQPPAKLGR